MTWTGAPEAPPSARIAALLPSLQPSERRVAETIAEDAAASVDMTAQQLATAAGVGRASVVRAAQSLGYEGYPQLRVALAREEGAGPALGAEGSLGVVLGALDRFSKTLPAAASGLTAGAVEDFLEALDGAGRVVVAASGLSAPLAYDITLRLVSAGRPVEYVPDSLAQRITASQLVKGDVLLAISGSGTSTTTVGAAITARAAGATVLGLTAFARSPLAQHAHTILVVPSPAPSFTGELLLTSRAGMALVIEGLVEAFVARRGRSATDARAAALTAISDALIE